MNTTYILLTLNQIKQRKEIQTEREIKEKQNKTKQRIEKE